MPFVTAGGHRLEYAWFGATDVAARPIVMLHEGLGSLAQWKDFPEQLAAATRRRVLAYSRWSYGASEPLTAPHGVDFMHVEALETLPQLLDSLGVHNPVLFGHSDGASMALIHAARAHRPVTGVVVLAPHVFVERYGLDSIAAARGAYLEGELRAKLARYHDDVEGAFWGWNDIWLHPDFVTWNIEALLPEIACPVLAIQGLEDEYGTIEQINRVARAVPQLRRLELPQCGHSPHRDQPEAVLAAVTSFLAEHSSRTFP
jgi:pimeloyl-ACP methyl ester carboxylesterase